MSEIKRKHPQFKGTAKTRQQKRSKERRGNVRTDLMNEGGFYKDMPGAHIDEYEVKGETKMMRKMVTFVVTEDGESKAQIFAPPQLIKLAMREAMMENAMTRQMVMGAAVDVIFTRQTPWHWFIRFSYKIWFKRKQRKLQKQTENIKPLKE